MYEMMKIFALLLALILFIFGIAYLVSSEAQEKRNLKKREEAYREEIGAFKKSKLNHTYDKTPAYKRMKKPS